MRHRPDRSESARRFAAVRVWLTQTNGENEMNPANKNLEIVKQTVFEFVVIKHPTVEQAEKGVGSEIVVPVTQVCANDLNGATMLANRAIPQEHMDHQSRLEVAVRPF